MSHAVVCAWHAPSKSSIDRTSFRRHGSGRIHQRTHRVGRQQINLDAASAPCAPLRARILVWRWGAGYRQLLSICDSRHSGRVGAGAPSSRAHEVRTDAVRHMRSPKLLAAIGTTFLLTALFVLLFALTPIAKLTQIGRRLGGTSPVFDRTGGPGGSLMPR